MGLMTLPTSGPQSCERMTPSLWYCVRAAPGAYNGLGLGPFLELLEGTQASVTSCPCAGLASATQRGPTR